MFACPDVFLMPAVDICYRLMASALKISSDLVTMFVGVAYTSTGAPSLIGELYSGIDHVV